MTSQEEGGRKKPLARNKPEDDIDSFFERREFAAKSRVQQTRPEEGVKTPAPKSPVVQPKPEPSPRKEAGEDEQEDEIKEARVSRAKAEAYRDVTILRKKAHTHRHKASKFYHRYKANEAKAQKCSSKAVAYREKAGEKRAKARECQDAIGAYESELKGVADGKSELSPEGLRTKMAQTERKAAKYEEQANKYEAKASVQTEKASRFRAKAARYLERNKLHESESRNYAKRADNLEKAG